MNQSIIILSLDLGERYSDARHFARLNPHMTLRDFLRAYSARFPKQKPPSEELLQLPMSSFLLQPVRLVDAESVIVGDRDGSQMRNALDTLWEEEQEGQLARSLHEDEPAEYPETIPDNEAVRIAYRQEIDAIADYLRNGLSVLVVCDKMLTEFVYEFVCHRAGKQVVLDTAPPQGRKQGLAGQVEQALQGGPTNPLANLPVLMHNLKPAEVLVLRSLDMLDSPPLVELLYQRTGKGEKPQLLAFLDPSLEAKKVLTDRFAVHVSLMGLPRYVSLDGQRQVATVTHLLTREERARFCEYDPEGLYKNVSGLNAIQFRNAMQYVGARVPPHSQPATIYRVIRQFKRSSSDEIEIPDTTFDDIGGYEHVKQQMRRIIALIAGPIQGIDERQRGQLIPRGFVFHGPPGTGKTLFAKAIANEMNATIQMVSGPEIMDKYVGQSENNLRRIFTTARRNAPAVVFFDEFDSIASQRSTYADGGARANNAVVAQFLTELDGFRQDQTVLIIGTSNRIDILDEALLRPSRLRPIEIGLPDYAARQHVVAIHAKNFGVEKLLKDLCTLAATYVPAWQESEANEAVWQMPQGFLDALFAAHPPYKTRYEMEEQRAGFVRELAGFFTFVRDCQKAASDQTQTAILEQMTDRLINLGQRYGLDLKRETLPNLDTNEAEAGLLPMRVDIHDLFMLLQQERRRDGLTEETFLAAVLDLIAEYTVNFNNDEIRAIFQEASLEHHMEGQLITPRYLGQKIGLIRQRRDERQRVHLSSQRGRR